MVEGGVFDSDCFSEGVGSSGDGESAHKASSSSVRDIKVPAALLYNSLSLSSLLCFLDSISWTFYLGWSDEHDDGVGNRFGYKKRVCRNEL